MIYLGPVVHNLGVAIHPPRTIRTPNKVKTNHNSAFSDFCSSELIMWNVCNCQTRGSDLLISILTNFLIRNCIFECGRVKVFAWLSNYVYKLYIICWLFSKFIFHSGIPSKCQLVCIQIRPHIMSGLIRVQTVLQRLSADETKELNKQSNNVNTKYIPNH